MSERYTSLTKTKQCSGFIHFSKPPLFPLRQPIVSPPYSWFRVTSRHMKTSHQRRSKSCRSTFRKDFTCPGEIYMRILLQIGCARSLRSFRFAIILGSKFQNLENHEAKNKLFLKRVAKRVRGLQAKLETGRGKGKEAETDAEANTPLL